MHTSRVAAPVMVLLIGAIAAACSTSAGGAGAYGTPAAVATTAPAATSAAAGTPAPATGGKGGYGALPSATPATLAGGVSVSIGATSLGRILVDGTGRTLYAFTPDSAGKSTCNGDCAANWPPLAGAGAPTLGAGLVAADFATITRDDGSSQVTFHGMPLYVFAGDSAAGDTKGEGLAGKWYVVSVDGKLVK